MFHLRGFRGAQMARNPPAMRETFGSIPRAERTPREANGCLLQCSCLENPKDRGAWRARVHGVVKELDTT